MAKKTDWRKIAPAPVILVSGPEQHFASSAIRRVREALRKQNPELEIHEVDANDYGSNQIFAIASPSLFSEPRLIIIDGMERCTDAFIEDGKKYLQNLAEDTTLIIRHNGSSVRGKALLEALRASDDVVEVECPKTDKEGPLSAFVKAEFAEHGRKLTDGAVRALVNAFANDLAELASACEQVMSDSAELIDEALVDRYFGGRVETSVWVIIDAALEGREGDALMLLRHGLNSGVDMIPLIAAFSSKFHQLARILNDRGVQPASVGMTPWQLNTVRKSVAGWDDDGMAEVLKAIAAADFAAKGSERQPEYRLEQLIMLVSRRGKAL
ncbi:MAG: DNA polymerase III subunit delta [Rhodoluna sp.]|nr:DNA polymerase III subunit delta [Rhodoluna sp.]